jgi:hypothetical protein
MKNGKIMHPTPCLIETSITDHQETIFFLAGHNTASNSLGDLGYAGFTKRF